MTTDHIATPGPSTVVDCPWCDEPLELPDAARTVAADLALECPACGTAVVLAGHRDGRRRLPVAA